MNELVELLAENQVLEEAFDLIKNEKHSIPINAKVRHLETLYKECCYNLYLWRKAEQEAQERGDDFYGGK